MTMAVSSAAPGPELRQCAIHGEYMAMPVVMPTTRQVLWQRCPGCAVAARQARAQALRLEQAKARWEASGVPPRQLATVRTPVEPRDADQRTLWSLAQDWLARVGAGAGSYDGAPLTLLGTSGRGKTHLACALLKQSIWQYGWRALYRTAFDVERVVRAQIRATGTAEEPRLSGELVQVPLLVIDELGLEPTTDFSRAGMSELLHMRYDKLRLATVLISNLPSESILARYGQGVADRYVRDAFFNQSTGESFRGME